MGAEREASVRVVVRKESAIQDLRTLSNETERFTRATRSGLEESTRAASGLVGTLKQGVGMAASFFGLHAGIGLVRDAMQIREEFQRINFSMEAGKGILRSWSASMADVWAINRRWGQDVGALTRSYGTLYEELGKGPDELASVLDRVARAATASGKPIERLADLGVVLSEKWDVPTEQLDDAFRTIFSLTSQGGVRLEEFMGQAARLGPKARKAGLSGTEDLANLLGFMNRAEQGIATPRQGAMAIGGLIDLLSGDSVEKTQKLRKAGVRGELIKGSQAIKDPFAMMREIVAATGGDRSKIEAGFGKSSPMSDILGELARPYREAVGGLPKDATSAQKRAAGLEAYDRAVEESRRVMMDKSRYEELAAQNAESASAQSARAMADLKAAMMDLVPTATAVASALRDVVAFIVSLKETKGGKFFGDAVDALGPLGMVGVGVAGGGLLSVAKGYLGGLGAKLAGGATEAAGGAVAAGEGGGKLAAMRLAAAKLGAFGAFASPMLLAMGVAAAAEGEGGEADLGDREQMSKRYRATRRYRRGDNLYEVLERIEGQAKPGDPMYRLRTYSDGGNQLLDNVAATDEYLAGFGFTDGELENDNGQHGISTPGAAVKGVLGNLGAIPAPKSGQSRGTRARGPAYNKAIATFDKSPFGRLLASMDAANARQEGQREFLASTPLPPTPTGPVLDGNAVAAPIVRALTSGVLRVEVVNTPKQGAPRNTQGP